MKYQKWMNSLRIIAILFLLIPLFAHGQSDSIDYQDFSRQQLLTFELQQAARIFPQAESYFHQVVEKNIIILKQEAVIDTLIAALGKTDLREMEYLTQLKLKDQEVEAVKPSFFQHPIMITIYAVATFLIGLAIGL